MTKNEIACRIADTLIARGATGRSVPNGGTMGDLLRDYERATVNEQLLETRTQARERERLAHGRCLTCGLPLLTVDEEAGRFHCVRHVPPTLEHLAEVRL